LARRTISEWDGSVADFRRGGCGKRVGVRDWVAKGEDGNSQWSRKIQVFFQHTAFPVACGGVIRDEWWYLCRECAVEAGWIW